MVDNRVNTNIQQLAPPSYHNFGHGAHGPANDYPAVHQLTHNTGPPHETKNYPQ